MRQLKICTYSLTSTNFRIEHLNEEENPLIPKTIVCENKNKELWLLHFLTYLANELDLWNYKMKVYTELGENPTKIATKMFMQCLKRQCKIIKWCNFQMDTYVILSTMSARQSLKIYFTQYWLSFM